MVRTPTGESGDTGGAKGSPARLRMENGLEAKVSRGAKEKITTYYRFYVDPPTALSSCWLPPGLVGVGKDRGLLVVQRVQRARCLHWASPCGDSPTCFRVQLLLTYDGVRI